MRRGTPATLRVLGKKRPDLAAAVVAQPRADRGFGNLGAPIAKSRIAFAGLFADLLSQRRAGCWPMDPVADRVEAERCYLAPVLFVFITHCYA